MSRLAAFLLLGLLLLPASSAFAREEREMFELYARSANIRMAVVNVMREQAQTLPGWCPFMVFEPLTLEVLEPVNFDQIGVIREGVWKDMWQARGCGADRVYNLLSVVRSGGMVRRLSLLTGTTKAAPDLQPALARQVVEATARNGAMKIACSGSIVADTAFLGVEMQDASPIGGHWPWREAWLVAGCGKLFKVPLRFIPMEGGGLDVKLEEAQPVR